MGFAANKIQQVNSDAKSQRSKILNQNPSQKSGKLRNITQPAASAVTNVAGTVSNVGHVVGKVSGALGATGLQKALEGSSKVRFHDTYGKKSGEGGSKEGNLAKGDRAERSGRSLVDFCMTFSRGTEGNRHRIDTECTFEMRFEIEPGIAAVNAGDQDSVISTILSRYMAPSITYDKKGREVIKKADTSGLAEFDMGIFVQKMTLPNITLTGGQSVQTLMGDFPVNGLYLQPDQHTFTLEIVSLRQPLQEDLFYFWMREITAPFWIYQTQPYTTANITIDLSEHMNFSYMFLNARPSNILTVQPSQEPLQTFTRQVQFTFDWMVVKQGSLLRPSYGMKKPKLESEKQGALDKIQKIGNAANFSASNILKL